MKGAQMSVSSEWDQSQFLPNWLNPKTGRYEQPPLVNAYRAAKGDLIVQLSEDGGLNKVLTWMPDILHYKGKLEKEHVDTCFSFFGILTNARRILKICDLRGLLADKKLEKGEGDEETDTFLTIVHTLAKAEANMMFWVVCDEYNRGNYTLAVSMIGTIKHAIENTNNILIDKRKRD